MLIDRGCEGRGEWVYTRYKVDPAGNIILTPYSIEGLPPMAIPQYESDSLISNYQLPIISRPGDTAGLSNEYQTFGDPPVTYCVPQSLYGVYNSYVPVEKNGKYLSLVSFNFPYTLIFYERMRYAADAADFTKQLKLKWESGKLLQLINGTYDAYSYN